MKKNFTANAIFVLFTVVLLVGTLGSAEAEAEKGKEKKEKPTLHGQLGHVMHYYLDIQELLAADSTKGLAKNSSKLSKAAATAIKLAEKDKKSKENEESEKSEESKKNKELIEILENVVKSADSLSAKKLKLSEAREVFKGLSTSVISIREKHLSEKAQSGYKVFYCSMAEAKWVQTDKKTRNPYYGKEMLTCGKMISPKHKDKKKGHEGHEEQEEHGEQKGHEGHGEHEGH